LKLDISQKPKSAKAQWRVSTAAKAAARSQVRRWISPARPLHKTHPD
jgi:hypothetical protein